MPTSTESARARAAELLDAGKAEAARSLLRNANGGADPKQRMLLGVAEFRLGDFGAAETTFRKVLDTCRDHEKAQYYVGLCRERQGDRDGAAHAVRKALQIEPGFDLARAKLEKLEGAGSSAGASEEPRMTEFYIPRSEGELKEYEDRLAKRHRAEYRAKWRGQPIGAKILGVAVLVALAAGALWLVASFFTV